MVVAHGGTHGRSRDTQGVSRDVAQPAADGYAAGASAYLRGRPSYPAEAVEGLLDHFGSPSGQLVVDLGAGTGQLTCPLADREVPVLAVDPVAEMLRNIPERVRTLVATAQSLLFAPQTVSAITVGNAFHWFANAEALEDMHRCLRPHGMLALLWNERDERVGWVRQHSEIVDAHEGDAPRFKTMAWKRVIDGYPRFAEVATFEVANPWPMTRSRLVDRILSTSFIAALPDAPRKVIEDQALALAETLPERFDYPYRTRVWIYERH